jgi:hypothetical protein
MRSTANVAHADAPEQAAKKRYASIAGEISTP